MFYSRVRVRSRGEGELGLDPGLAREAWRSVVIRFCSQKGFTLPVFSNSVSVVHICQHQQPLQQSLQYLSIYVCTSWWSSCHLLLNFFWWVNSCCSWSCCETVDPSHRRISDPVRTVSWRRLEVQRKTIFEPKFYHDFRTMIVFRLRQKSYRV